MDDPIYCTKNWNLRQDSKQKKSVLEVVLDLQYLQHQEHIDWLYDHLPNHHIVGKIMYHTTIRIKHNFVNLL